MTISPCHGNDSVLAYYSTSTYTAANFSNVTTATVGVATAVHNGPWTTADVAFASTVTPPPVQGRIVSVGVSIEYTGTVLNQGGLYYMLVEPNHQNTSNIASTALLGSYSETLIKRISSKKEFLVTSAIEQSEIDYYQPTALTVASSIFSNYPYSGGQSANSTDTLVGSAPLCILFTGLPGNTFNVEICLHMEYVGKKAQALLTPNHSDVRGFEMVSNASAHLPALRVANPDAKVGSLMASAIAGVAKGMAPAMGTIGQGIGSALGALAGGYFGAPVMGGALGSGLGRSLTSGPGRLLLTNG